MGRFLFGISSADPITLLGAAISLLSITAVASAIPGTRPCGRTRLRLRQD